MEQFVSETEEEEKLKDSYSDPTSLVNRARKMLAILSAITFSFSGVKASGQNRESADQREKGVNTEIPNNEAGRAFEKIGMHKITPLESSVIGEIEVKVLPKEGFSKIVFVIKQRHPLNSDSQEYQNLTTEQKAFELQTVTRVQEQIQTIVDWIHKETQTTNIVLENIYPEDMPYLKDAWKDEATARQTILSHIGKQIDDVYHTGVKIPNEYIALHRTFLPESVLLGRPWIYPIPGDRILRDPKKLARINEIRKKYGEGVSPGSKNIPEDIRKELERIICTDRENHVLDLVREQKDPTSIVIYGASHDFTPEVETSNTNNEKICLVVITPELIKSPSENNPKK